MMLLRLALAALLACGSVAAPAPREEVPSLRIMQSNDDGWAEANARALFSRLTTAGHHVILSAPALDRSATGGVDFPPVPLPPLYGCQYNSCLPRSLAVGHNGTNPRLNYVNSFPVSSVRVGLDSIAPKLWNGSFADLVVSGVNVGYNLGLQVYGSGTNNVAMYAARNGVPAIAFSGHHRERVAWNKPTPWHSLIYADIAQKLVMTLAKSGKPYLPERVWLNVNLPKTSAKCNAVEKFKFVLTKIDLSSQIDKPNLDVFDTPDVDRCGNEGYLPHETLVESAHGENECVVTISVGATGRFGTTTVNAGKAEQKVVMEKLKSILTCLKN